MAVTGRASDFWEARKSSIDFPLCSRDDQEWFSIEFRVWQDTRDPSFVFDLSSPVSSKLSLPADVLRNYTLEFEIRVERALMDLRECLKKAIRDKDYCRELATLRAELDRRGPAPPSTEAECVQLRSRVLGLEDKVLDPTQRFAALDHTWVKERAALEVDRVETSSSADGLALELVQVKAYIHSTLSMEYG